MKSEFISSHFKCLSHQSFDLSISEVGKLGEEPELDHWEIACIPLSDLCVKATTKS